MAINKIKQGRWNRQIHLATAGVRAGFGWASDQITTLVLPSHQRELARSQLMQKQAENWVQQLGQLKGSIVKIGQILATYADYFLPAPLAEALHKLEADTEAMAWSAISIHINESLQGRQRELIIEPVALAAASLSQVHTARIKKDNHVICLKILYPGITKTLDSDLAVLEQGFRWWLHKNEQQHFSLWIAAIHDVMIEELDLQLEAIKLKRWEDRLKHESRYVVPVVDDRYCAQHILAMSFESGVVQHHESISALSQERRNFLAENMLELFFREVLLWGEMQTDPHPGNYRIRLDEEGGDQIILLDFGSVRKIGDGLLQPLRQMILSAYRDDRKNLLEAVFSIGLLSRDTPLDIQHAFTDVLLGLVEPLNYRVRLIADPNSVPAYAVDDQLNYCWAAAKLPKRMGKQAFQSAFSKDFSFPGADFLLVSRKLAGVYAFIAAMDARFDASCVIEKIIKEMPVNS
jgi:predicted unusual protein kinase regulating ubiquinone biosynthesis (AarF/ABC1/UbiB family)